jgi:hypothetical protein
MNVRYRVELSQAERCDPVTKDSERQDLLLDLCRKVSGIALITP